MKASQKRIAEGGGNEPAATDTIVHDISRDEYHGKLG